MGYGLFGVVRVGDFLPFSRTYFCLEIFNDTRKPKIVSKEHDQSAKSFSSPLSCMVFTSLWGIVPLDSTCGF